MYTYVDTDGEAIEYGEDSYLDASYEDRFTEPYPFDVYADEYTDENLETS